MFIVFEGIDGCGKTTQVQKAEQWFRERLGAPAVLRTFEPGDWEGGADLRSLLLGGKLVDRWSEFFLFMTDRCEHARRVLLPGLAAGRVVLCDRYTPSTLAYQILSDPVLSKDAACWAMRLPELIGLPEPDVVFYFDIDSATARKRTYDRAKKDAFDGRENVFFDRVRLGYEYLMREAANTGKTKWIRIDASRDIDAVAAEMYAQLENIREVCSI